jgi:AcrR family transcriptional regulator
MLDADGPQITTSMSQFATVMSHDARVRAVTASRARTSDAIVDAAVRTWVRQRRATLAVVADAAGTHRATLHRHFPDRATLLDAAVRRSVDMIRAATEAARVDDGPPREALRRLVGAYLGAGTAIRFLFEDITLADHPAMAELDAGDGGAVLALIRRGQADGSFDPTLAPAWVERAVWALVYAAAEAVDDGTLEAHDALATLLRSIENGLA